MNQSQILNKIPSSASSTFLNTVPPTPNKSKLTEMEDYIMKKGDQAKRFDKLKAEKEARDLFISLYSKPDIIKKSESLISYAKDLSELIETIRRHNINIISSNPETGAFNVYANDYLLQELESIRNSIYTLNKELKLEGLVKAKKLTRACGLRYKVLDIMLGVK